MTTFNDLWALLRQHGSSAKRETECAAQWATYPPDLQQRIYATIRTKLGQGKFVHFYKLLSPGVKAPTKLQAAIMSAYYRRFCETRPSHSRTKPVPNPSQSRRKTSKK